MRQFICFIRHFIIVLSIFAVQGASGQSTYPIRTDTLRVYSGAATGPTLKLESSTSPFYNWYLYTNGSSISRLGGIVKLPYAPAGNAATDSVLVRSAIDSTIRAVAFPSVTTPDLQAVTDVGALTTNPVTIDVTGVPGTFQNALLLQRTDFTTDPARLRVRAASSNAYVEATGLGAGVRILGTNNSTMLLDGAALASVELNSATESRLLFRSDNDNYIDMGNAARNRLRLGSIGAANNGLVITDFNNVPVAQIFTDGRMGGTAAAADTQFSTLGQVTDSLDAREDNLVHISGTENITGAKTFNMTVTSFGTYISTNGTVQSFQGVTGGTVGSTGTFTNHNFEFYSNNAYRGRVNAAGRWQFGPSVADDGSTRMQVNGNVSANAAIASNHLVTRQQVTDTITQRLGVLSFSSLYTDDGTLTGPRTVNDGGFPITWNFQNFNIMAPSFALFQVGTDAEPGAEMGILNDSGGPGILGAVNGQKEFDLTTGTAAISMRQDSILLNRRIRVEGTAAGGNATAPDHFVTKFQLDSVAGETNLQATTNGGNATNNVLVVTGANNITGHPSALTLGYDDVNNVSSIVSGDFDAATLADLTFQAADVVMGAETLTLNGVTGVTFQSNVPIVMKKIASADLQRVQADRAQVDEDVVTKFQLDSLADSKVNLQATTPGTAQTGHVNITGTITAPTIRSPAANDLSIFTPLGQKLTLSSGSTAFDGLTISANGTFFSGSATISNAVFMNGAQYVKNRIITATTTALPTDHFILCNTTSGDITLSLPSATGIDGFMYRIKKSVVANTLTIDPDGAEQIIGFTGPVATVVFTDNTADLTLIAQGGNWYQF